MNRKPDNQEIPEKSEFLELFDKQWKRYVDEKWNGEIPEDRVLELLDAFYYGGQVVFDILKKYVRK